MKEKSRITGKRKSVGVYIDPDIWLILRRHRADTGESVSATINRLVRANVRTLTNPKEIPA